MLRIGVAAGGLGGEKVREPCSRGDDKIAGSRSIPKPNGESRASL
jgi:hypothetical protein